MASGSTSWFRDTLPWYILGSWALIAVVLSQSACAETIMYRQAVRIRLDTDYCDQYAVSTVHGSAREVTPCRYDIVFREARGGFSTFGPWIWNDHRPEYAKRVTIRRDTFIIRELSYVEIVSARSEFDADSCRATHVIRL